MTLRERIQLERQASGEALEVIVEGNDGHLVPRRIRTHQEVSIRALHALATTCTEGLGRAFATRRLQWKIGDSAEMVLKSAEVVLVASTGISDLIGQRRRARHRAGL